MRILDKYIFKELLGPFVFGVGAFSSIFIGGGTLYRIAQYITQYGAGVDTVVKLFVYSLPEIIVMTFPMSMLLASLMSFGRLSSSSEIIAMKSGGISFYRLTAPVFVAALAVSVFSMVFSEKVVPQSKAAYNNLVRFEIEKNTKPRSQEHIVIKEVDKGSIERLTYARRFEESDSTMYGITIQEFEADKLVRVENAEKAIWQGSQWIMQNGVIHDLSTEGKVQRSLQFDKQIMPVDKNPQSISTAQKKAEEMSISELKQYIKTLKREFVKSGKYETELHQRITIPMASLVFAMIGAPLGLQPHRTSSSIGLGLSIIIIFAYYTVMTIFNALGQGGAIYPMLAAWIPNLAGIIAGVFLIRKASR
ncbi:MAG: permease YjgP/YjgQ family protein [Anaerosporomusa subterranea]|jgi:lipopolysaccharide export system permease protein|nr:permease YjgP/YjgQ family protein [Anaerosporomusa subterranea]